MLSRFSRALLCATYGQQPTRLLCPWDSPGKNTGMGCHLLLGNDMVPKYLWFVECNTAALLELQKIQAMFAKPVTRNEGCSVKHRDGSRTYTVFQPLTPLKIHGHSVYAFHPSFLQASDEHSPLPDPCSLMVSRRGCWSLLKLTICSGQNGGPPERYVCAVIPETCYYYLIWQRCEYLRISRRTFLD